MQSSPTRPLSSLSLSLSLSVVLFLVACHRNSSSEGTSAPANESTATPPTTAAPTSPPPSEPRGEGGTLIIPKTRLQAPAGVNRWEPSGAAVIGDELWIVSDRGGRLAAYSLPLPEGAHRPIRSFTLELPLENRLKLEGLELQADGSLLILEVISRSLWRCAAPLEGCPSLERVDLSAAQPRLDALPPRPFKYVMLESVLVAGGERYVGTRGYMPREGEAQTLTAILNPTGAHFFSRPEGFVLDGRSYGLSGATATGEGLWTTWSSEKEDSVRSRDLFGLVAYSAGATASEWGTPTPCYRFQAKPEGVARWRDQLIVVFDEDKDRKGGSIPSDRFPLEGSEDYAWSGPARCESGN